MTRGRVLAVLALLASLAIAFGIASGTREGSGASRGASTTSGERVIDRVALCDHPYLPGALGTTLRYEWHGPGGDAEIHLRLAGEDAEVQRWTVETIARGRSDRIEIERRCGGDGAEEPWVGLGVPPGMTIGRQSWVLPREPRPGDRWSGVIELSLLGVSLTLTREQRVVGRERIAVGAATYDALHVAIVESSAHHATPAASEAWIARGVGLVRMSVAPGTEHEAAYELSHVLVP